MTIIAYCVGNIVGAQVCKTKDPKLGCVVPRHDLSHKPRGRDEGNGPLLSLHNVGAPADLTQYQ